MSVKSASDPELDVLSEGSVIVEWCFAIFVIAGVFGEFFIALRDPPLHSDLARWGPVWADFAVGAGVAIELVASVVAHICQSELTRRSNAALTEANTRLGELEMEAGFAKERAAKLEEEAWVAKLETERLRDEIAPRSMDDRTFRKLLAALSEGTPGRVTVAYASGDAESAGYSAQFVEAFLQSKWRVGRAAWQLLGAPTGIHVQAGHLWSEKLQIEIDRVRAALLKAGLTLEEGGTVFTADHRTDRAVVVIGHKPPLQR
jgi:hypothetical protein